MTPEEIHAYENVIQAQLDLAEVFNKAVNSPNVQKPISYALYHTWKKWEEKEKPRKKEKSNA